MVAVGIVVAMLAACGRAPSADRVHEATSPEIVRCAAEQTRLHLHRRVWPEDRMIARRLGISVEEFQRQQALAEEAGRLGAKLDKNERNTFGDLEIKHGRDFRVVAYFTRDGKQTIRRYVRCTPLEGFVEVRTVEASIKELGVAQEEAGRITHRLGIRADSDIDITKNRVAVYVTDAQRLEAALRASGEELPEHVVVVEVEALARPL